MPLKGGTNGAPLFSECFVLAKNGLFAISVRLCARTLMGGERRKHLPPQCAFVAVLSKRV